MGTQSTSQQLIENPEHTISKKELNRIKVQIFNDVISQRNQSQSNNTIEEDIDNLDNIILPRRISIVSYYFLYRQYLYYFVERFK